VTLPVSFAIRSIRPDDILNKLSLGTEESAPLKAFLRREAIKYEKAFLARTHVLVDEQDKERRGRVWGYITLAACDVQTTEQNCPEEEAGWNRKFAIPAVKLARLAVDKNLQGKGLGTHLVDWAMSLILDHVGSRIGCRLLVTDAKRQSIGFYEKLGFTMLDTEDNKRQASPVMFVHLPKLRK
jgi:ribosomal protein S18 acetylase RimI-like enzyme